MNSNARRVIGGLEECESNGLAVSFQNSGVRVPVKNIAEPLAIVTGLVRGSSCRSGESAGISVS